MRKDYCEKCGKEIFFKNCYEISHGKVEQESDGCWNYTSGDNINVCPKCYKIFKKKYALEKQSDGGNQ